MGLCDAQEHRGKIYIPVAPESMIPVLCGVCCVGGSVGRIEVGGLQGKAVFEVSDKLGLEELLVTAIAVPHRHKQELQLAGRLLAFFGSSKQSSGK